MWACVCVCARAAERQRGEAVCAEGAAEGVAAAEARPGESPPAGRTHPQEGEAQEGDGKAFLLLYL